MRDLDCTVVRTRTCTKAGRQAREWIHTRVTRINAHKKRTTAKRIGRLRFRKIKLPQTAAAQARCVPDHTGCSAITASSHIEHMLIIG